MQENQSDPGLCPSLQAVGEFRTLLASVQKSSTLVAKAVAAIARASICKAPAPLPQGAVHEMNDFYEEVEQERAKVRAFSCSLSGLKAFLRRGRRS